MVNKSIKNQIRCLFNVMTLIFKHKQIHHDQFIISLLIFIVSLK